MINFEVIAASYYLSDADNMTTLEQYLALVNAPTDEIPDGVNPWIHFENIPANELVENIEHLARGFKEVYELGQESIAI